MPPSRTDQKSRGLVVELVRLVAGFVLVGDRPVHCVPQIDLAEDDVVPGG